METVEFYIEGLDCANCAKEIERNIAKMDGIDSAKIDFMSGKVSYTQSGDENQKDKVIDVILDHEPDVKIVNHAVCNSGSCSCCHEEEGHHHNHNHKEDDKNELLQLIIGASVFVVGLFFHGISKEICMLIAYVILGQEVLKKAFFNIGKGRIFDENFLMAIATLAAMYLHDYSEAAGVMLFYQIGEYLEDRAVKETRNSIASLMDIRPDVAYVMQDGEFVKEQVEKVALNDIIQVKPGERVPLDGIVVSGKSSLNTSSLTGESNPVDVDLNDEVMSGVLNETGVLELRVTHVFKDSTVSRILALVENSNEHESNKESFITRFARWYTPLVTVLAVVVALVVGFFGEGFDEGIYRACTFLVISCPCALVISIPLSFFAGIGGLSKKGILVKGADVIEEMNGLQTIVFDKTGTVTTGMFHVKDVVNENGFTKEDVLYKAAVAESYSNHPLGECIVKENTVDINKDAISDFKEIAGRGLQCVYNGEKINVGNKKLLEENGIEVNEKAHLGACVYVSINGTYAGTIVMEDTIKDGVKQTMEQLHSMHKECVMISGDRKENVDTLKSELNLDQTYSEMLPQDKVNAVKEFKEKGSVGFVGDGVNDAPVLNLSDVGFAMGGIGSDAAIEASDVVLMNDSLQDVVVALKQSKRIVRIANQNIYGAIGVKLLILALGAFGYANMWIAIFADTGVAMICVMNAMRLLQVKTK